MKRIALPIMLYIQCIRMSFVSVLLKQLSQIQYLCVKCLISLL